MRKLTSSNYLLMDGMIYIYASKKNGKFCSLQGKKGEEEDILKLDTQCVFDLQKLKRAKKVY